MRWQELIPWRILPAEDLTLTTHYQPLGAFQAVMEANDPIAWGLEIGNSLQELWRQQSLQSPLAQASLVRNDPEDGAVTFLSDKVNVVVRALTHVAYALAKIIEQRFTA